MKTVIVKGIIAAAAALLCAGGLWQTANAASQQARVRARKARAREIFDQRCARCHGRDGRGETRLGRMLEVPDFTDGAWWGGVSEERVKESISKGMGPMPAFGRKLTRRDISSLAAYVRGFGKVDSSQ